MNAFGKPVHGREGAVLVEYEYDLETGDERLGYELGGIRTARRIIPSRGQSDPKTRVYVTR